MKKILVIETSPNQNGEKGSLSQQTLNQLLKQLGNNISVTRHNLDKEPYFKNVISAENFKNYFDPEADKLIEEIVNTDVIIFATPTINFGVPALLKSYLDKVLQAGKTFKYKYDHGKGGSVGLVPEGKKGIIINTQGSPTSWYPFTATVSQIEGSLEFIGINNIKSLIIDGTKTPEISPLSYEELIKKHEKEINELVQFIG